MLEKLQGVTCAFASETSRYNGTLAYSLRHAACELIDSAVGVIREIVEAQANLRVPSASRALVQLLSHLECA